jgi:hypothetical protein
MKSGKWHWTLIATSFALLISLAAGCVTVTMHEESAPPAAAPIEPAGEPTINSFTASPEVINPGQGATLSWDVSGATMVDVQPEVGSVSPSGSAQVSPDSTTTYTLTAANEAGSVTISLTVTVSRQPDLVITDIWFSGGILYYKIKNQGEANAGGSRSYLYVNGLKEYDSYAEPLAPGQEMTNSFSGYVWRFSFSPAVETSKGAMLSPTYVKVCADAEDAVSESDEGNNCGSQIWGETFVYDFVDKAHLASWRNGTGELKWPMAPGDKKGTASVLINSLVMCPEQVSQGWIQGRFADFYVDKELGPRSRPIVVPPGAKFIAKVGFKGDEMSTDGVSVALGYLDATGSVVLFPKMDVYPGDALRDYDVDLSDMSGRKTEFILWVEAKGSPAGNCIKWVEPKIIQKP